MSKKRVYDLVIAERRGDGDDAEVFWHKIGVVLEGEKGLSFKMNMIPVAWDGWGYLMEPREKDEAPKERKSGSQTRSDRSRRERNNQYRDDQ